MEVLQLMEVLVNASAGTYMAGGEEVACLIERVVPWESDGSWDRRQGCLGRHIRPPSPQDRQGQRITDQYLADRVREAEEEAARMAEETQQDTRTPYELAREYAGNGMTSYGEAGIAWALLAVADEVRSLREATQETPPVQAEARERSVMHEVVDRARDMGLIVTPAGKRFEEAPWAEKIEWVAREVLAEQIRDGEAYVPWEDRGSSRGKRAEVAAIVLAAMTNDDIADDVTHEGISRRIALAAGVSVDTASEIQDLVRGVILRLRSSAAPVSTGVTAHHATD